MPAKISIVRHAQGYHNATRNYTLPDPLLTGLGKSQCADLSANYPHHADVSLILASPLRRTIQTAACSFGPALARDEVEFICLPELQEVSDLEADRGTDSKDLKGAIDAMFAGENLGFDTSKINIDKVGEGWNSKQGYFAYTEPDLKRRAADVRAHVFDLAQMHAHIVIVTHGAIAHFITEDFTGTDGQMIDTAYLNCEVRDFAFAEGSTREEAHLVELEESRAKRTAGKDEDPHVMEEIKGAARETANGSV